MSGLDTGTLDKRITLQKPSATRDARLGTVKAGGWIDYKTLWAEVRDVLPSRAERLDDTINIARRPVRIRLRYRTDITSDMRILYGTRVLQIVAGPAELGRRDGLELMAEEYSSGEETA
jgi:SPP1 family predicted phage head-tail adaptor